MRRGDVLFEVAEKLGIENHAVLDHFGQPGAILALAQRRQHGRVDEHSGRLPEGADHVLGARQIDAHLAADRAVDLRQQRGWHLHEAQPAGERGGDEAGQVADHAAADGNHDRLAIGADGQQLVPQAGGRVDRLRGFTRLDDQQVDGHSVLGQAFGSRGGVRPLDVQVGDDYGVRRLAPALGPLAQRGQIARADLDRIASRVKLDVDRGHARVPRDVRSGPRRARRQPA